MSEPLETVTLYRKGGKPRLREDSGGVGKVFVQDPTENIPTMNSTISVMGKRNRGLLGKSLMRRRCVVVVNVVLQHTDEIAVVQNE
jgi:hypothetical protein